MRCEGTPETLDAYIDSELDVLTAAQFERHLAECTSCFAACQRYRRVHDAVKATIPSFAPPKGLEDKIRASLRQTERKQDRAIRRQWFSHGRSWAVAVSVMALLVLSALIFQLMKRPPASELLAEQVVSSHIRSLMPNHLRDVISTDQHTVKPWFSGKLDFSPGVNDLSSEGFPLIGGRLDYLDNRPVAALVYKRRQHTINLFIWPSSSSDSNLQTNSIRGFNTIHWTQASMTYWAVSDLNAAELREFARDLQNIR